MHRSIKATIVATLICLFAWSPSFAQSVPKEKQAEFAFEFRLDKLRATPMYDMFSQSIDQMQVQAGVADDIDIDKVVRVFGAVAFPESVAEMEAMENVGPGQELPMELFMRIEFADEASADKTIEMIAGQSEVVTEGGKTWYTAGDEGPSNIMAHRLNATTIEAGTEEYLSGGTGKNLFSSGLATAWDNDSGDAIRIAFDLENSRDLIDEAVAMAKENAPPMAVGMIDLINKVSNISVSVDFSDGGNLFTLAANGTDEAAAEELSKGLDGLLALAKMGGAQMVEGVRSQDEEAADVLKQIFSALKTTLNGTSVEIAIPKPDGFESVIQTLMRLG